MNVKTLGVVLVVGLMFWKSNHDSNERQARIDETATQHQMSPSQKTAFKACLNHTEKVEMKEWTSKDGTKFHAGKPSMEVCACQSEQMVKVFTEGHYASHGNIVQAMAQHSPDMANLDVNDLADEWKQKPQAAKFMLSLGMAACVHQERDRMEKQLADMRKS